MRQRETGVMNGWELIEGLGLGKEEEEDGKW